MPSLYTLAFPRLTDVDRQFVENFRREHDPKYRLVAAHFSLVFGCSEVNEAEYQKHVQSVTTAFSKIHFSCHTAALGKDEENGNALIFLVPDQGCAEISKLHDHLYEGLLAPHLRVDLPYAPHITVGSFSEKLKAEQLCARLNQVSFNICGEIEALSVCAYDGSRVTHLAAYPLR